MIFEFSEYRSYLKAVLVEKSQENPAYSLRAMARDLGVAPSVLTNIFKSKRNLSHERALEIATRLGLTKDEREYFALLVQFESAKSLELKDRLLEKIRQQSARPVDVKDLSIDAFKFLSDWYHLAILEMTRLKNFDFTEKNIEAAQKQIAARLSITELQVSTAIERLKRLEMIAPDENGRLKKTYGYGVFKSPGANQGLRDYHKQMLQKAIASLETQTNKEKWVGSETFSIDVSDLDRASELIENFMQNMLALFDKGQNKTETYHLGVQLFNLTKRIEK